jgi:putative endonuclease
MALPGGPRGRQGTWAEDRALRFLGSRGLELAARNYRCRLGELDLVMRDGPTLVFVEVRYRRPGARVRAAESVNEAKQQRLVAAARDYLARRLTGPLPPCRFDVVAVSGTGEEHDMEWIRDAFEENGA